MVVRTSVASWFCSAALFIAAPLFAIGCASSVSPPVGAGSGGSTNAGSGGTSGSGGTVGGGSGGASAGSGGTTAGGSGGSTTMGSGGGVANPDAAPKDAAAEASTGTDAPAGGCSAGQLCFDFENGTAGAKPGAPWTGQGTLDATRAVSGKNSLHVTAGGDNAFAMIKPSILPTTNNEYYGRVMFWVDSVPSSHWTFVRSRGPVPGMNFTSEYTYGGTGKMMIANYDTQGVSSDCWKDGGTIPLSKWACMEWHFKGATNEMELWIDGTEDTKAHVVGKGDGCVDNGTAGVWNAPTFNELELGFAVYGAANGFSVWFDDLALGTSKLGCPAP